MAIISRANQPYKFRLIEKTLTDGSHVYDVVVIGPWDMRFPCISISAAEALIADMQRMIDAHTVATVDLGYTLGFERE